MIQCRNMWYVPMLLISFTKTLILILLVSSLQHLLFPKFIQDNHYSFHFSFSFDKSAFPSAMMILTPYVKVLVVSYVRIERYSPNRCWWRQRNTKIEMYFWVDTNFTSDFFIVLQILVSLTVSSFLCVCLSSLFLSTLPSYLHIRC